MSDPQPGAEVDLTDMKAKEHRQLLGYIDDKIRYWRGEIPKRQDLAEFDGVGALIAVEKAISYVDAYQTARVDLFGEALSE